MAVIAIPAISEESLLNSIRNLILNLYTANKAFRYRDALIELLDFIIKNDIIDEEIKKCVSDIQTYFNSLAQDSKKELDILLEDDFFKIYKEYLDYKENKTSPKLSRIDFFAKNGNHYAKNRPDEFNKVYKKKFDQYNKAKSFIEKDIYFSDENKNWSEYILEECEKRRVYLREKLEKEEKAILKIKEVKQEKLNLFLKTFRDSRQKYIYLVDENHHLIKRENEINLYLAFGYEVFEPNPQDTKNFSRILLKPSENYKYTEDFEKELIKFFEKQQER